MNKKNWHQIKRANLKNYYAQLQPSCYITKHSYDQNLRLETLTAKYGN